MSRAAFAVLLCLLFWAAPVGAGAARDAALPLTSMYPAPGLFEQAIGKAAQAGHQPVATRVTGIAVPHHLLAADLIAEGFFRLRNQQYDRVVLLCPDHFLRGKTPVSTTRRSFRTALGLVEADREWVSRLAALDLVSESNLFSHEHGAQAQLPFVARFFPQARVVPLAIKANAGKEELEPLFAELSRLLRVDGEHTLVVQSTDFSHYLTPAESRVADQETLRLLAPGDPDLAWQLEQPRHVDSRAAQYLQLRLQREVFQAGLRVAARRDSGDYGCPPSGESTSYMVHVYTQDGAAQVLPKDVPRFFFAGDAFFGRHLAPFLAPLPDKEESRANLCALASSLTGGAPLILNLEGALQDSCPPTDNPFTLCMERAAALDILGRLNVRAASLANNHSHDLGDGAYAATRETLALAGILPLEHGALTDMGPFTLAALTDIDNNAEPRYRRISEADLDFLDQAPENKPLFALVHWGEEYSPAPGPREEKLQARLRKHGVEFTLGCHSHRASALACETGGCVQHSLGNFVFDQYGPRVSGALLEVAFFPGGVYFPRLVPLPNLYQQLARTKGAD